MKIMICLTVLLLGILSGNTSAQLEPTEIRLRDLDFDGLGKTGSGLSLMATFDVRKENLYDAMTLDFYILLEPRDEDVAPQFFHSRITHRYLEEKTGYISGVNLEPAMVKCIDPRDAKYAVVVTYKGEEVDMDQSEEKRWWEGAALGKPIENILTRSPGGPVVRSWESPE